MKAQHFITELQERHALRLNGGESKNNPLSFSEPK